MGGWRDRTTAAQAVRGAVRPLVEIAADPALRAAWARLARDASDANPFWGPDFLVPLMRGRRVPCAVVLAEDGAGGPRLLAFLPLARTAGVPGLLPARLEGLRHPMIVDTTPLLDRTDPQGAAAALVETLAAHAPGAVLRLPLCVAGATADALDAAAAQAGLATARVDGFARAAISRDGTAEPSTRKRKELRRAATALARAGTATYETVSGADVGAGVAAFLALERSGWKGAAGTALACAPETRAFADAALSSGSVAPRVVVDLLRVDGRPVAASVHILAGDRGGTFKCAYDERFAKASPGQLLDAWTAERVRAGEHPARALDSCAAPGHPIESLWTDRLAVDDRLIALSASPRGARLARIAERLRRLDGAVGRAKAWARRRLGRRETALRAPPAQDG
ncbi:GNAT family N-acetyltransferase [Salinarimonas rosea]|uniref:GNAT family N-acetyltransferase n=1 Tax=Salinarimonas rosea TaxID=552063 RepID=UPI0003F8371A|nr:GNAT family N-acetyltransferase [Salinarimonas rosea]